MANRSDFFNAKLPRSIKRSLAMAETYGWAKNAHERGDLRRAMIAAHASHVGFKLKRNTSENRDSSDGE
jgi:predicted nucleic acid-binding protein